MKNISINPRLPLCGDSSALAGNLSEKRCGTGPHACCLVPSKTAEPSGFEPSGGAGPDRAFRRDWPPLSFVATSKRTFTGATPSRQLSGDADYLHWSGPMADSDVLTLRSDIKSMYLHLADTALAAGYYVQPVMVWYRILDADGKVLHRSVPVIVGTGIQGDGAVMAESVRNGSVTVGGFKMSLEGFRLGFVVPEIDGDTCSDAVALEIMVTPMLNMLSLRADAEVSMGRNDGSEVVVARMSKLSEAPLIVASVLDRLDDVSRVAVRIVRPFAEGITGTAGSVVAVSVMRDRSVTAESDGLLNMLKRKARSGNRFIAESTVPHGFEADVAVRVGDMMVYGAVSPLHRRPPRLSDLAVRCDASKAYTALVRVTSAGSDGAEEILSTSDSMLSMAPDELSPLIAYPLPNAVKMEIQVTMPDGTRRVKELPLRPTPDGAMAYYLDPDLKPIAVEPWSASQVPLLPVDRPFGAKRGGLLAVSFLDEPFALRSCIDICDGDIVAVAPATRSSSAWDFARRHLYLFSTSGVYSVAVNASCTLTSAHLITPLPVMVPGHATYSPEGVYFLSEGSLYRVTGSKAELVMADIGADALTWNQETACLCCRKTDGSGHIAVTADGRWAEMHPDSAGNVRWHRRLTLDGMNPAPLRRLRWLMSGSGVSLDVAVRGDSGCEEDAVDLLVLHIDGSICSPVRSAVRARPFRYLTVEVSGTVGDDFRLGELLLGFD